MKTDDLIIWNPSNFDLRVSMDQVIRSRLSSSLHRDLNINLRFSLMNSLWHNMRGRVFRGTLQSINEN